MKVPPYLEHIDIHRLSAKWRWSQTESKHIDLLECPACKAPLASRYSDPLHKWQCGTHIAIGRDGKRAMRRTWACVQLQALRAFIKEIRV